MDGLQAAIASLGIVALMLLLVLALCRRLGPKASAWVQSEHEETVGLSKNQLFHANGYMIHQSGSDILLSSTGSFKRFESIDRECVKMPPAFSQKPPSKSRLSVESAGESATPASTVWTATTITAPALVSSSATALTESPSRAASAVASEPVIPPQPLRPAPAPAPSTIQRRRSERALRQHSNESVKSIVNLASTAIPRPLAHLQFSSPAPTSKSSDHNTLTAIQLPINPSDASRAASIALRSSTNPFLIDSLGNGLPNNQQKCHTVKPLEAKQTTCIQFNEMDEQFAPSKTHLGPAAMSADVQASVRSWLENELATNQKNQAKSQNNPFMPLNLRTSTENICADNFSSRRSSVSRRFDDNFLDYSTKPVEVAMPNLPTGTVASSNTDLDSTNRSQKAQIHQPKRVFRSRSRSAAEIDAEPEILPYDLQAKNPHPAVRRMSSTIGCPNSVSTNPFRTAQHNNNSNCPPLQKTLSETYLGQWDALASGKAAARQYRSSSQQWQLGKALLQRQYSSLSLMRSLIGAGNGGYSSSNGSQSSLISSNGGEMATCPMQRAQSCESVSSDSSVQLADLQKLPQLVTGQLCVALHVEKSCSSNIDPQIIDPAPATTDLCVSVLQAKELRAPLHLSELGFELNTFVRLYLVPDAAEAAQTRLASPSAEPSYQEEFRFAMRSAPRSPRRRSLWFHLYHSCAANSGGGSGGLQQHTLIGEVELPLTETMLTIGQRPTITWLRLADTKRQRSECGDLLFSISYLPTAERLTVVVVKARNLRVGGPKSVADEDTNELQNVFVKVYLLKDKKKVSKKKTSAKRLDNCPIYNESMIFSVPPYMMHSVQVRLTIMHVSNEQSSSSPPSPSGIMDGELAAGRYHRPCNGATAIGHVIVGDTAGGRGMRHWKEMLSSLRKPIAMWHPIRQTRLAANDCGS